jgi:peptide/nickel transport system substrate-binding protein
MRATTAGVLVLLAVAPLACRKASPSPPTPRPLRVLLGAELNTLDPQVAFDDVSGAVLENIFEGLVRFDRDLLVTTALALRWVNPDETTWRFYLDPEARFADGSPVRASDVKFSIERLRSLTGSELAGFAQHVVAANAVDDLTIDLHTDTPIAILNSLAFIPILSERHVRAAGDRVGESPLGTGPYRLVRWDKGKAILLEANEKHRPLPAIRQVEFVVAGDQSALLEGILRTTPDLTLFVNRGRVQELREHLPRGLRILEAEGVGVFFATFNVRPNGRSGTGSNPLANPPVRRALALGTDRNEIVRGAIAGTGQPASQLVGRRVLGFDPGITAPPYDPAGARALLSGLVPHAFSLEIVAEQGTPHAVENMLARQWSALGLHAGVRELPRAELPRALSAGAFDVAVQGFGCTSADASEILGFTLHGPAPAQGFGAGNVGGYRNPEVDRIVEENLGVFDPRKRLALLQRVLRIASEDVPFLPLFAANDVYVVSEDLVWEPPVNGLVRVSEMSLAGSASR